MPLTTGTRLGPYEIVSAIGAGGMGEVYRAHDSKLHRDVALKVLPASVAGDPDRLARFRREAQVLASLNHPNIAQVYGFEDAASTHALVMELVEGRTLGEIIDAARAAPPSFRTASGPAPGAASRPSETDRVRGLPLDEALAIARQLAEGLEFAHEHAIVHRDLKPANIKVRDDGTVKILDFGLAKALGGDDPSGSAEAMNSPTLTARATQMGVILGTAAYMAPEQAKGKPVDRRADIWAFGLVVYEMLAGRRGYDAEDVSDTLAAVLTRDVDWTALPPDAPPRLVALLHDCLARDPKRRLRDIGEAVRVLDQLTGSPATTSSSIAAPAPVAASSAGPASALWRRALPWTIAALALLVAGVLVWRTSQTPPPANGNVTRGEIKLKDLAGLLDVSRDGSRVVYTVSGGTAGFHLYLREMDQFEGKPIPGADGGLLPVFSPDGEWIAYTDLSGTPPKIKKLRITGGTPTVLCDGSLQDGGAWMADDTIVFPRAKGLVRVSANGGTPQPLTTVDASKGEAAHIRPQVLPGGRQLLFTVVFGAGTSPQFAVLDLRKGTYRTVAPSGDNGRYAPTGHLTYVRNNTLFAEPFDLATLQVTGSEVPVVEGVSSIGPPGTGDYAFSNNGLLVYSEALGQQGTTLAWTDRHGAVEAIPGQVPRTWGTGRLSPDGTRVANAILTDKGSDIWVVDLKRGTPARLTFGGVNDLPIWSPDGRRVVYSGNANGKQGVYSVLADGSGQPTLLIATATQATPTSFTPDGRTLLYTQADASRRARVMVLPLTDGGAGAAGEPRPLRDTAASDGEATVSPDGKWVALISNEAGTNEAYLLPFPGPGPKTRISNNTARGLRWTRDGRELIYWTAAPGTADLIAAPIQTSPTLQVGEPHVLFQSFAGTTFDVAPDGQHFLVETIRAPDAGLVLAFVTNWFDELRQKAPGRR